jgi:chromosomal replication initiator protein
MAPEIFTGLHPTPQRNFIYTITHDKKELISKLVFDYLNVDFALATSKTRVREAVEARQIAMYIIYTKIKSSQKEIGAYFGGRDHSTVNYALETVRDLIDTDRFFRKKLNAIIDLVEQK